MILSSVVLLQYILYRVQTTDRQMTFMTIAERYIATVDALIWKAVVDVPFNLSLIHI